MADPRPPAGHAAGLAADEDQRTSRCPGDAAVRWALSVAPDEGAERNGFRAGSVVLLVAGAAPAVRRRGHRAACSSAREHSPPGVFTHLDALAGRLVAGGRGGGVRMAALRRAGRQLHADRLSHAAAATPPPRATSGNTLRVRLTVVEAGRRDGNRELGPDRAGRAKRVLRASPPRKRRPTPAPRAEPHRSEDRGSFELRHGAPAASRRAVVVPGEGLTQFHQAVPGRARRRPLHPPLHQDHARVGACPARRAGRRDLPRSGLRVPSPCDGGPGRRTGALAAAALSAGRRARDPRDPAQPDRQVHADAHPQRARGRCGSIAA